MPYESTLLIMVFLLLVLLLAATIYRAPTRGCFTYIITIVLPLVPLFMGEERIWRHRVAK